MKDLGPPVAGVPAKQEVQMIDSTKKKREDSTGRWQFILKGLLVFVGIVSIVLSLFLTELRHQRDVVKHTHCFVRLGRIGFALESYHRKNGAFPPAYICDKDGTPMHSWRVLILPQLGYQSLYEQYSFNEPWNGPNNRQLVSRMPLEYACPTAGEHATFSTSYVAVVGERCAWRGPKGVGMHQITDGLHETILLVEVADSNINWMEPRDMTFDQALVGINGGKELAISSHHRLGDRAPSCLTADYVSTSLPRDLSPQLLRALLTIDGGEKVDARWSAPLSRLGGQAVNSE